MKKAFVYLCIALVILLMLGFLYVRRVSHVAGGDSNARVVSAGKNQTDIVSRQPDFTELLDEPATAQNSTISPRKNDLTPSYVEPVPTGFIPTQKTLQEMPTRPGFEKQGREPIRQVGTKPVPTVSADYPQSYAISSDPQKNGTGYTNTIYTPTETSLGQSLPQSGGAADEMGGYLAKLTWEQQKELNQRVQDMSLGIDEAILRAMAPKSKQDEAVAKYLQRRGTQGNMATAEKTMGGFLASSPEGQIMRQMASQAQSIVQSVREAYGEEAAAEVSTLMDEFQREMAELLGSNLSPEEKQRRAQALNKKYNDKLQEQNEKQARNKMETQLRGKNEKLLAQIGTQFGSQTESAVRTKLEEYLQKRLNIYQTYQSEEAMYKQLFALEGQQQKDIEDIIRQNNPTDVGAIQRWRELQNKEVAQQIQADAAAVKNGEKEADYFRMNDESIEQFKQKNEKTDAQEQEKLAVYGTQAQNQIAQLTRQLRAKQEALLSEGGTVQEVNDKNREYVEQYNAEVQKILSTPENKKVFIQNTARDFANTHAERLQHYNKFLSEAGEDARAQVDQVLSRYDLKRAQILADRYTNADYAKSWEQSFTDEHNEIIKILSTALQ